MKPLILLMLFVTLCGSVSAKSPSGVYELIQDTPVFRRIERWDFREDGTVLFYSRLESYDSDGLKSPPHQRRFFWKSAWFGKEIFLKVSKDADGDGVAAFTQDGEDLIGTGKFSEYSERYVKKR